MGDIVRNIAALGLEPGADAHLHGQHISPASRTIQVNPMFTVIKAEEHGGIAACRNNSIGDRFVCDFVMSQERGAF
jgi:hypothetical protein